MLPPFAPACAANDRRKAMVMKIVVLDGYTLNPGDLDWAAIFADVGVMVLAVLNATRALYTKDLTKK